MTEAIDKYTLDENGNPVPATDFITWAKWFEDYKGRSMGDDTVKGYRVSTVFLGLDHSFGVGEPLLFETCIFGKEDSQVIERYSTKSKALEGHKYWVEKVKEGYQFEREDD